MGQQQLLFLVLCIVVVGIAVVAGIVAFIERNHVTRQNEAVNDAIRIATSVQAWKQSPSALGGGEDLAAEDFTGISLKALGYPVASSAETEPYLTLRGCYKLAPVEGGAEVGVFLGSLDGDCDPATHIAKVLVTGPNTYDIIWIY